MYIIRAYRRWTCASHIVQYTELDDQCDKLHGQVGANRQNLSQFVRRTLTVTSTDNGPVSHTVQSLQKKVPDGSILICVNWLCCYNTVGL